MVRDAFYFIVPLSLLTAVCFFMGWTLVAGFLIILLAFVGFFFRNPERLVPEDPSAIVSPADGKVILVEPADGGTRLSIFLSVFDVHVNRAPISGKVTKVEHRPGSFRLAWDHRASVDNERVLITIEGSHKLTLSLVAGLVARRIIAWKKVGEEVTIGERLALIRFGSRVDMLIPEAAVVQVRKGDRVKGGSSILANWRGSSEEPSQ